MNKLYITLTFFFLLIFNDSFAQPGSRFKNEWINYNQQYLKIVINTKGIYRITKAQIEAKGLGIGANPQKLQLFHRGEEMAITVDGESPSNYNYIEFFAINNDGFQDDEVYVPKQRFNENFSIYSDSTSYFLTVGQNNGKRTSNTSSVNASITADNYFFSKALTNYTTEWNQDIATSILPPATQSYFEPNEGLCSVWYYLYYDLATNDAIPPATRPLNLPFNLPGYNNAAGVPVDYEALLVSRNPLNKQVAYNLGNGVTGSFGLTNFNSFKLSQSITTITGTSIPTQMNITTNPTTNDMFSIAYQKAKYPRIMTYVDNLEYVTKINGAGLSRLNLTGANANIIGYDFTDFKNQKKISSTFNSGDNSIDLSIDGTTVEKSVWLSHTPKAPVFMRLANFSPIVQSDYNYLIISDPRLKAGAEAYKAYRESMNGGQKFNVLLKYTQDLYDEFCYGERNPIAIRRFADYMTSTPAVMKYLFLIGKSYSLTSALKGTRSLVDFVPTFGNPGSDNLLTGGLLGLPLTIPAIPTGRLVVGVDACGNTNVNCSTAGTALSIAAANQEIFDYIGKVNQHEHRPSVLWQKNMLNVAGAKTGGTNGLGGEYESLPRILDELRVIAKNYSGDVVTNFTDFAPFNKPISAWNGSSYPELAVPEDFYAKVNSGTGIINYFGHGTNVSTSYNIGYVSKANIFGPPAGGAAKYSNDGKYPLLVAMGCGISNSFSRDPSLTADWVKTPGKGALLAIGQSTISYESYDDKFLHSLYNTWFTGANTVRKGVKGARPSATNAMVDGAMGDILKQSFINELAATPGADPAAPNYDIIYGASFQQTILEGDPAIQLLRDPTILPLSLTLLEVKASNEDKLVKLNWKTENEVDFNKFEIEKSIDSKKFEKIGEVFGTGINQEISGYSFDDLNPALGVNYYRLKMIDLDGTSEYSKIVSVNYENIDNHLIILENPFRNNQFSFKLINLEEKSIKLYDIKGNRINVELSKMSDNKYKVISRGSLQKAIYLFEAYNNAGKRYSSKIISE